MKIRNESINKNYLTPSIIFTLGIATVLGVGIYNATNIANTSNANALSYSTSKDISFTFAPTLSIGLSTDSLTIDNLVPGTTSDSNTVSVTVSSNTPYGYVLSAGVGSTVSTDPYYNTSDLVHDNSTTQVPTTNKFSSISTTASLESLNTDNTWGYSTSTDGGTSWSTYSGLSHAETKPLLDMSDPATPSTIDFKIAARSASTQASGTYNNVITFYAVGKPKPMTIDDLEYLQEFGTIAESDSVSIRASMPEEVAYSLKDKRDDQDYTIAKLKDGKIWMTKNLNLAGGSVITSELSDVPDDYTLPVANNFQSGNKLPNSDTWGFNNDTQAFVYNSAKADGIDCSSPGCYSYYSWTAATVGSGRNISKENTDAPYSICPKGWRLPTSGSDSNGGWKRGDFYALATAYGANLEGRNELSSSIFYNNAGPNTAVPNFLLAGYYYGDNLFGSGGISGSYWSSTSASFSGTSRYLYLNTSRVYSANSGSRRQGYSVRCLVK